MWTGGGKSGHVAAACVVRTYFMKWTMVGIPQQGQILVATHTTHDTRHSTSHRRAYEVDNRRYAGTDVSCANHVLGFLG